MRKIIPVTTDQYLPLLLQLLDNAHSSIDILAYSFAIGSAAGKIATEKSPYTVAEKLVALKNKYGKQIRIRIFIEGGRETSIRNKVTGQYLKKAGITVRYGSTHVKGFCIDETTVLFGSTNLTHQSLVNNIETNLLIQSAELAKGFQHYFEHLWKGGKHGNIILKAPWIADGYFKDELLDMINKAKSLLEFSIYFFHHSEVERALIRAIQRGVRITALIHNHNSFALSFVRRTRATAERLISAKAENIFFGKPQLFTHSKYLIRDRSEIILGTGNWLHEDVNIHPQLHIRLSNKKLAIQLSEILGKQIRNSR